MSPAYVLTSTAAAELRAIVSHTRRHWGQRQAGVYADQLLTAMDGLTAGLGAYKDLHELRTGLRAIRCGHHYIYVVIRPEVPALIIVILHERMDLMTRLSGRIDTPKK
ncbi:type II toxin-antitoxin system RelE/ParE family toxin [Sphingobium sp. YR768]|uniref:type II toxin-antitoxin system RelE/ParE family toxin n=1 Tax=Sphingobium sp. YR768 TaxID=1884365 RepID=UPI0008B6272F|nr:type II toxin-antitoxin system RelE/ParE family toxin [Sphingobium sp. YR768]SEQ51276.1 Plasmid stabilization system protein ParE [Sphingobium sp. YR768]